MVMVMDRDDNFRSITSNEAGKLASAWTFAAGTTGATGAHTVFTVTGDVLVTVWGSCDTDLAGATATVELGTANNTAALIAQTTATDIDDGDIWQNATPTLEVGATLGNATPINDGADIVLTVATAAVSAGVLNFYLLWRPISDDGNITVTTPAQRVLVSHLGLCLTAMPLFVLL